MAEKKKTKLFELIQRAGGVSTVARRGALHLQSVYKWREQGHVSDNTPVCKAKDFAKALGCDINEILPPADC